MTDAHHATFSITRELAAPPARVYGAFADIELKSRWFGNHPDCTIAERTFDFRTGGRERAVGHWKGGRISDFQATYFDITDGKRIVYVYDMYVDHWKMSVSLATIEVEPNGTGSKLTVTEQGVFFGPEGEKNAAGRAQGTGWLMDALEKGLAE